MAQDTKHHSVKTRDHAPIAHERQNSHDMTSHDSVVAEAERIAASAADPAGEAAPLTAEEKSRLAELERHFSSGETNGTATQKPTLAEEEEESGLQAQPIQAHAKEPSKDAKSEDAFEMAKKEGKQKRTPGLWIVDNIIYQINNFAVFAISVVATYLTSHGDKMGGKFGMFMFRRGEWFRSKAMGLGLNESQADMAKMVTFSFLDGSLMAPFVKMMEDRRESMARWIDRRLGTEPEDESVYTAEPKQSWGSVLMGRFLVAGVVVPTAVVLDKLGLNDKLFGKPGLKVGEKFVEKFPKFAEKHSRIDMPGLFKTGFFEAFYTTVCTAGLYVTSRFIAGITGKNKDKKNGQEAPVAPSGQTGETAVRAEATAEKSGTEKHAEKTNAPTAQLAKEHAPEKQEKAPHHSGKGKEAEDLDASVSIPDYVPEEWTKKVAAESRQVPVKQEGNWQSRSAQRDSEAAPALH